MEVHDLPDLHVQSQDCCIHLWLQKPGRLLMFYTVSKTRPCISQQLQAPHGMETSSESCMTSLLNLAPESSLLILEQAFGQYMLVPSIATAHAQQVNLHGITVPTLEARYHWTVLESRWQGCEAAATTASEYGPAI